MALAAAEGLDVHFEVGTPSGLATVRRASTSSPRQGTMVAPDHETVARDLARVCRPGGRLGLTCWRPGGAIEMFSPAGRTSASAASWRRSSPGLGASRARRELLGEAFELELLDRSSPQTGRSGEEVWQLFSTSFGPRKTLGDLLERDRREGLHRAFVEYYEGYRTADGIAAPREYLLSLGRRRAV